MEDVTEISYRRQYARYGIGLLASLAVTIAAYVLATGQVFDTTLLYIVLGGLAIVQMIVQLVFFLHLGEEMRPRLRLLSFTFMTLILVIIVAGSVWIMHHLNENMMQMTSGEKTHYMSTQKDKGF